MEGFALHIKHKLKEMTGKINSRKCKHNLHIQPAFITLKHQVEESHNM